MPLAFPVASAGAGVPAFDFANGDTHNLVSNAYSTGITTFPSFTGRAKIASWYATWNQTTRFSDGRVGTCFIGDDGGGADPIFMHISMSEAGAPTFNLTNLTTLSPGLSAHDEGIIIAVAMSSTKVCFVQDLANSTSTGTTEILQCDIDSSGNLSNPVKNTFTHLTNHVNTDTQTNAAKINSDTLFIVGNFNNANLHGVIYQLSTDTVGSVTDLGFGSNYAGMSVATFGDATEAVLLFGAVTGKKVTASGTTPSAVDWIGTSSTFAIRPNGWGRIMALPGTGKFVTINQAYAYPSGPYLENFFQVHGPGDPYQNYYGAAPSAKAGVYNGAYVLPHRMLMLNDDGLFCHMRDQNYFSGGGYRRGMGLGAAKIVNFSSMEDTPASFEDRRYLLMGPQGWYDNSSDYTTHNSTMNTLALASYYGQAAPTVVVVEYYNNAIYWHSFPMIFL